MAALGEAAPSGAALSRLPEALTLSAVAHPRVRCAAEVVARLEVEVATSLREHGATVAGSGDKDLERSILAAYQVLLDALCGE